MLNNQDLETELRMLAAAALHLGRQVGVADDLPKALLARAFLDAAGLTDRLTKLAKAVHAARPEGVRDV